MAETGGLITTIRPEWPAPANVRAIATTRAGGVSAGVFASLNLGTHVGDDPTAVAENRQRLRQALALPGEPQWLDQVHGIRVARAAASPFGPGVLTPSADAMFAMAPGLVCAVLTADCLPVLFCDDAGRFVAAAHAGWRGLAESILEATIAALMNNGVRPASLLAWLGPAIRADAYEVGADVRDAFLTACPEAEIGFQGNARGRWQLDLAAIARLRLADAGVRRIYDSGLCTCTDARFFSYRRDGVCGRQASLIWIEPESG